MGQQKLYQGLAAPKLRQTSPQITGHKVRNVLHAIYDFAKDGGAVGAIVPITNGYIPANAVIYNVIINSTTAVTSGGSATIAIGTSAGSTAAAFLAATAKTSFTLDGFVQGVPIPSDSTKFVKMSAAGKVQITVAVAALTAGVIEILVEYDVTANA